MLLDEQVSEAMRTGKVIVMKTLRKHLVMLILALLVTLGNNSPAMAGEIHKAADDGDITLVRLFLAGDAELINSRDEESMTPLHYAALNGNPALIMFLLEKGADVNVSELNGQTPLHLAVIFKSTQAVHMLLAAGAMVNATDNLGQTPLHLAAMNGFNDIAGLLLQAGAEVNRRDSDGETPLRKAETFGQQEMIAMLLSLSEQREMYRALSSLE